MVRELLDTLKQGKENAISKWTLASMFNVSERVIRKTVETLRNNGVVILTNTDKGAITTQPLKQKLKSLYTQWKIALKSAF